MILKTLASLAALATLVSAQRIVKPCFGSRCKDCQNNGYEVATGVPSVKEYDTFDSTGFAETNSTGGFNVWWDITSPGSDCAIIIYEAFASNNGTGWGNVVLETRTGGCFFSNMGGGRWATQFCCGQGDCGAVQPGDSTYVGSANEKVPQLSSSPPTPTSANGPLTTMSGSSSAHGLFGGILVPTSAFANRATGSTTSSQPGPSDINVLSNIVPESFIAGVTRRSAKFGKLTQQRRQSSAQPICSDPKVTSNFVCVGKAWELPPPNCSSSKSDRYTKSGQQRLVTALVKCNVGSGCEVQHTDSLTISETLTSEHSVTSTTTNGLSVSIEVGFKFGEEGAGFSVGGSTSYEQQWSKAIADSTGFQQSNATTTTDSYSFSPPMGVDGFVSFTPNLDCQSIAVNCDGADLGLLEHCTPVKTGDNMADGEYMWVTVGGA